MTLIDDYFNYQTEYEKKFGNKTIVLLQKGSFYEIYEVNNEDEKIGKALEISLLLNMICSKANKNILEISRKNPYMCGFPCISLEKQLNVLQENNYTVVLIEQVNDNFDRKVTQIISPGTNINSNKTNYICSLYFENFTNNNTILRSCGIAALDITTGKSIIYQILDKINDENYVTDELFRLLSYLNPKEIVLNGDIDKTKFIEEYELDECITYYGDFINDEMHKIVYQNKFLNKIFPSSLITPIENLNLEMYEQARIAFLTGLQYIYEHNPTLLDKIDYPVIWDENKYCLLSNQASSQLNIISSDSKKYTSLYNLLNNTSTCMGKRLLLEQLLNPIKDKNVLEKKYNEIQELIKTKNYEIYRNELKQIVDLERYHRRGQLGILQPIEFINVDKSYKIIDKIFPELNIKTIYEKYNCFKLDELSKYKIDDMTGNFLKLGENLLLDNYDNEINILMNEIEKIKQFLLKQFLNDKKINDESIKLQKSDKEGFFFLISKGRFSKLKLDSSFYSKTQTTNVKIMSKDLDEISDKIKTIQGKIKTILSEFYVEKIKTIFDDKKLKDIVLFISNIDVLCTNAYNAIKYNLFRPTIVEGEESFIECKQLRHPLVEQIINIKYVPNDIILGKDTKGIILFGLNSGGKTVCAKSIGLAIVMAQAGMYVASKDMKYVPFDMILTRILGNDNLVKSQSSFAVEMLEMKNIFERCSPKTLVLGDEICRSTESLSALALVASSIVKLSKKNVPFMYTSHLHGLVNLKQIKELSNITMKHLKVKITNNGDIIYERKLQDGPGDSIYGIEVANQMVRDKDFIKLAYEIRREQLEQHDFILNTDKSKYNSKIYKDQCEICGATKYLDVHHKNFQCTADQNNNIDYYHKNNQGNLQVLCKKHHQDIHKENK